MGRARKAVWWMGIGLLGLALLLVLIVLLPSRSEFEPRWLRSFPPASHEAVVSTTSASGNLDQFFEISVRRLTVPMTEVRANLDRELPKSEGWSRTKDSWSRREGDHTVTIYAIALSDHVEVNSMLVRPIEWRDRVKIWWVKTFRRK